ncbi:hypothetical protein PV726_16750 [Streptomyces europaeiscabiei]|uniref:hypothetical protein n=1 Tax=Streptomyces europaeiscabiei TaxID=146819 RepID=UPI0029A2FC87|nr:hypothetical protein [Streptomyces europaeiscabiei]MDX3691960.1 hypothetical protein [Streptomyces europaeiscabiei]
MRTVISRRPVRGGLLAAVATGSLLLGATGCGGDEDGVPEDYKIVTGTQLCGGRAVSAEASRALKVITGSSRFEASAEKYTVAQAATDLVEAFPVPTVGSEDACRVYTPLGTPDFELRITWRLEDGAPTGTPAPKFTVLKMGERALAAADMARVYFACRSERLADSSRLAHIQIGVEHRDPFHEPEGDIKALKDAYATVAHSFSLAMAKELRCEKNGGLPARPVLDPA